MAAVAVANLEVLESPMKQQKRLRPNVKLVRRVHSKDEDQKRRAIKSYLKTIERTRSQSIKGFLRKKKVRETKRRVSSNEAFKSCLKTVEVAKNQLNKELLLQLKNQYHLDLESYAAQSLEFLKISKSQDMNIWLLADHLKKYYVVVEQMVKENVHNKEYHDSLQNTRNQISQLMEIMEYTAMLMTVKISKHGYPSLPEELKIESSRSLRQNRDYLFVKEYKNILDIIEEFLKNY